MKREECMKMLDKQIDAAWVKFRNNIKDAIDRAYAEGKRNAELTVDDVTKMIQDALNHHVSWPGITYPSWPTNIPDYDRNPIVNPPYVFTSKDKVTLEPSTTAATTINVKSNPASVITTAKNDKVTLNEETDWR